MRRGAGLLLLAIASHAETADWIVGFESGGFGYISSEGKLLGRTRGGKLFAVSSDRRYACSVGETFSIFAVPEPARLADIALAGNGFRAEAAACESGLAAVAGSGRLLVIDIEKRSLIRRIALEGNPPHAVTLGGRIYVSNGGSGTVTDIDAGSGRSALIRTDGTPGPSVLSPDGKELYVANPGASGITIVDTARKLAAAHISTCKAPGSIGLIAARRQLVYVCHGEKRVAMADVSRRAQIDYLLLPDEPVSLTLSSDGKTAAVCAPSAGLVYIIGLEQKRIVSQFATPPGEAPTVAFPLH
jgi:hypothetical protein